MRKLAPVFLVIVALAFLAWAQTHPFSRYKKIEAYEVRPGVLMMPRYSADGQACEIGLEKRRYSPEVIRVNPEFLKNEIDEIVNDLVPPQDRGSKLDGLEGDYANIDGSAMITASEYENVSIQTYSHVSAVTNGSSKNALGWPKLKLSGETVAAAIRWKNRKCS